MKLRIVDTRYYRNGTNITCKMKWEFFFNIFKRLPAVFRETVRKHFNCIEVRDSKIVFQTTGTAKLHPDDDFDLETGRRIAESKASLMAYRLMGHVFDKYDFMLECRANDARLVSGKYYRIAQREREHSDILKGKIK